MKRSDLLSFGLTVFLLPLIIIWTIWTWPKASTHSQKKEIKHSQQKVAIGQQHEQGISTKAVGFSQDQLFNCLDQNDITQEQYEYTNVEQITGNVQELMIGRLDQSEPSHHQHKYSQNGFFNSNNEDMLLHSLEPEHSDVVNCLSDNEISNVSKENNTAYQQYDDTTADPYEGRVAGSLDQTEDTYQKHVLTDITGIKNQEEEKALHISSQVDTSSHQVETTSTVQAIGQCQGPVRKCSGQDDMRDGHCETPATSLVNNQQPEFDDIFLHTEDIAQQHNCDNMFQFTDNSQGEVIINTNQSNISYEQHDETHIIHSDLTVRKQETVYLDQYDVTQHHKHARNSQVTQHCQEQKFSCFDEFASTFRDIGHSKTQVTEYDIMIDQQHNRLPLLADQSQNQVTACFDRQDISDQQHDDTDTAHVIIHSEGPVIITSNHEATTDQQCKCTSGEAFNNVEQQQNIIHCNLLNGFYEGQISSSEKVNVIDQRWTNEGTGHLPILSEIRNSNYTQNNQSSMKAETTQLEEQFHLLCKQQKKLKSKYLAFRIACLPWMETPDLTFDDGYVEVKLAKRQSMVQDVLGCETTIQDLLLPKNWENVSQRILVEGKPGYGKTTLLTKIARDWAKNEKYTTRYDLILVLYLPEFVGNWEEMIIKAAEINAVNCDAFVSLLRDASKQILLLFDGFEKLAEDRRQTVSQLLSNELPSHVSVIVTSTPGIFATYTNFTPEFERTGNFIDAILTINGLSSSAQQNFVQIYTKGYSEDKKKLVIKNLESMVHKDFLKCPIFLLMFIELFKREGTDKNDTYQTKTVLFKQIFNDIARRHFRKLFPAKHNVDLFVPPEDVLPTHVELVYEFGKFALGALQSNIFVYTKEDILGTKFIDQHGSALELTFFKQNLFAGFREQILYEPVHISFFEFAAAYYLWMLKLTGKIDELKTLISFVRPKLEFDASSHLFPFLLGLLGTHSRELLEMLTPYQAEYSHCFLPLGISLMQIEMTFDLLQALTPFIPEVWRVPWCSNDSGFSSSSHHAAIVGYGTNIGKIKCLSWNIKRSFSSADQLIEVQKLEIIVESPLALLTHKNTNSICCTELLCSILSFEGFEGDWKCFVSVISAISYQCISFLFPLFVSPMWLTQVYRSVLNESFQTTNIHWLCATDSGNDRRVYRMIEKLIQTGKVSAIRLPTHTPEMKNKLLELSAADQIFKRIIHSSARSANMRRFILQNETAAPFTFNLAQLCGVSRKTWKCIYLNGVDIQYTPITKEIVQIECLMLPTEPSINTIFKYSNFLKVCKVKSLVNCRPELMLLFHKAFPFHKALEEIHIAVSNNLVHYGLHRLLQYCANLHIVAFGMPEKPCPSLKSVTLKDKDWMLDLSTFDHLKRIEVWWKKHNLGLVTRIVTELIQSIERAFKPNKPRLQFQYFCLHTHELGDDPDTCGLFLSSVCLLKQPMAKRIVPKLQVICPYDFTMNLSRYKPNSISSWFDVFPPNEGFILERHLWGDKTDDAIWGREINNMPNSNAYHVYTVTFIPCIGESP